MANKEIIEALKAAFTGYEANDRGPMMQLLAPDFAFEMSDSLPYGGLFIGPDDFRAYWEGTARVWHYFRYDAREILDCGDTVVVPVKTDSVSLQGIRMQNEHLFLFKVADGLLTSCRLYADTARGRDVIAGIAPQRLGRVAAEKAANDD